MRSLILTSLLFSAALMANDQYNQGSEFAKGIKGKEQAAISGFNPADALPKYNSNPKETEYYGGTTNASTDLSGKGNAALNQSEEGKAISESILNTPADSKPSMDAPFISVGTDAQNGAESVTDGSFDGCVKQDVTHTEYTNHVCSRDTKVDQYCERRGTLTGDYSGSASQQYIVDTVQAAYTPLYIPKVQSDMKITFNAPFSGRIKGLNVTQVKCQINEPNCPWTRLGEVINIAGRDIYSTTYPNPPSTGNAGGVEVFGAYGIDIKKGDLITLTTDVGFCIFGSCNGDIHSAAANKKPRFVFTFIVDSKVFKPRVDWSEKCPFSKAEGALTKTECIEPGGNKTIYVDGQPYTMYSDCWAYKDTYLTQAQSEGTCKEYMNNPACTIANRQCAYGTDGFCLHENLTYSCEHKTSGSGVMCGGTFFCKDGSCAQSAAGKNNAFQKAVSQLAAVAAAGKDVAALNGVDVRAFTGKPQFCKKFAAGFSNCCKDSGWGQDIGLASCSSEEKALGAARTRKITVDVGEFCSKKVLGVCVEKKRGYCVFESKLAQIVQQQGRQWQLGVSFGGADSPDCRGITMEQLQNIKFDNLDFSNFYEDLKNGSAIPQDNALIQRAQQQIQDQVNKNSGAKK